MKKPLISIIIPCRNAGQYLLPCLESIAAQTWSDFECIVVDDGSSDDSKRIAQYYALADDRFICATNPGSGIISALRTGYQSSTGQYITRMDADDVMFPVKLEQLHQACLPGTVATGQVAYFATGKPLGDGYRAYAKWLNANMCGQVPWRDVYRECIVPSPAWMLRRDDLDKIGAFDHSRYPEDYDLCFRMYKAGLRIAPTKDVVHQWRDYDNRTSRTDDHYSDHRFLDIKVDYFITQDYQVDSRLILWGAGRKGKAIAQRLISRDLPFTWVTNNEQKIGHNIYGKVLCHSDKVDNHDHCIIAVASKSGMVDIKASASYQRLSMHNRWWFC